MMVSHSSFWVMAAALLVFRAKVHAMILRGVLYSDVEPIQPMSSLTAYANDCGRTHGWSFALQAKSPGAGMDPESINPYDVVLKSGYMHVGCVRDKMFEVGDKFGRNKLSYQIGETANVSIVHYKELVPKEDQEPITHTVCFKFCRTIPLMSFFGIIHGRDCYCTPFFHEISGDSSECDAQCNGDSSAICGGKTKSSMFSMHACADTAVELRAVADTGKQVSKSAIQLAKDTKALAQNMQKAASETEALFTKAGDPAASELLQFTKAYAGKLLHAAEVTLKAAMVLDQGAIGAEGMKNSSAKIAAVEKVIGAFEEDIANGKEEAVKLRHSYHLATRGNGKGTNGDQYYPLMYFVDKQHKDVPTTCAGDVDKHGILAASKDDCAAACSSEAQTCVGFSYYKGGVCLLISKFKSLTYYTKCGGEIKHKATTACYAKLARFDGVSLKPDGSGKCDVCLDQAIEARRCF